VPALLAREILLRKTPLRAGGWLFTLVTAVALAISALYELIEWWTALLTGARAEAFLGTQGDPWTRSGTCSWPSAAPSSPSSCSHASRRQLARGS